MSLKRQTALMSTEIDGYSPELRENIVQLGKLLRDHREMVETSVRENRGKILQLAEDSFLVSFSSSPDALRCAFAIKREDTAYG
jgi:class 3 adenylate cyclase